MDINTNRVSRLVCIGVFFGLSLMSLMGASAHAEVAPAYPGEIGHGIVETYHAYRDMRSDMDRGFLKSVTKRVLEKMVDEGCARLRLVGEFSLADQFEHEWQQQISVYLSFDTENQFSTLELGDFDPLSPWLANFYETLYRKTRGVVKGYRLIHDIYLMNYALAVVFHPNGSWRKHTSYDRIEYRKHFIPFANTATYWTAFGTCKHYLPKYAKYCGYGASFLEKKMGRYIAPVISDQVFAIAVTGHELKHPKRPFEVDFSAFEAEMNKHQNALAELEE